MTRSGPFLASRLFWPMLALGLLDRLYLLWVFGFQRVGDDDAIIWSAAIDYAHGVFSEPYFYGQDYAVMLEALVAAPFTWLGVPLHILMPSVTSFLALAPFWSFAFWHRKHGRNGNALLFLAMPVLLPVEYGMLTTITRSFVQGIALLAFLPWAMDLPGKRRQALLIGLITSAAAFCNPNSLVFSVAFLGWYLLKRPHWPARLPWVAFGTAPFIAAYSAAQAYCQAHPERMVHTVHDWRMTFLPGELIPESFTMLNLHFRGLFPLFPSLGGLAFAGLAALALWHLLRGNRSMGWGLAMGVLLIIASFGFPKTHDGFATPYYAYARMFLAVPLLLAWGMAGVRIPSRIRPGAVPLLLVGTAVMAGLKVADTPEIIARPIPPEVPVAEMPIGQARAEAAFLAQMRRQYQAGLVVALPVADRPKREHFVAYLYPLLEPELGPTWLERDRRYWQHEAYRDSIVVDVMLVGIGQIPATINQQGPIILHDQRFGAVSILRGNTKPTAMLPKELSGTGP